ncbi:DoxX family protein [Pseudomonas vanderleydeniana]|uniref:DoxX family protein n=1 Tax=Pseudomonas vanderleydeniana TaxID=2745495 RepID=A0A9E6PPU5_9PSED|nr:DoxX family protein [Pseudomonas vanderleydeniana]QXI30892.1 DoxX family protein [Pseudomonas vanderleydeniana]
MNSPLVLSPAVVEGAYANDYGILKPSTVPHALSVAGLAATLLASVYCGWGNHSLPDFAAWSSTLWSCVALLSAVLITPRAFVPGFLISLLPFLIAWRVAAMNDAQVMVWVASLAAVPLLLQFIDCVMGDLRRDRGKSAAWLGTLLWQATVVRLYFGLNELCHSSEKIFAGLGWFHKLEVGFQGFGLGEAAAAFVVLGGLIEFASAVSVGLGLFARLGAFVSLIYFLVATIGFGGEWSRGYAWASPGGGGWEYVMLLLVVFAGVLATGAGKFSLDGWLLGRGLFPRRLMPLAVNARGARHD